MSSIRQLEANKRNASRSTGPRTPGGKLRSCHNALRHGLASRIADDPVKKQTIDRLADVLAEGSDDFWKIEQSRAVAEAMSKQRRAFRMSKD